MVKVNALPTLANRPNYNSGVIKKNKHHCTCINYIYFKFWTFIHYLRFQYELILKTTGGHLVKMFRGPFLFWTKIECESCRWPNCRVSNNIWFRIYKIQNTIKYQELLHSVVYYNVLKLCEPSFQRHDVHIGFMRINSSIHTDIKEELLMMHCEWTVNTHTVVIYQFIDFSEQ